jgi:hypothetical protein
MGTSVPFGGRYGCISPYRDFCQALTFGSVLQFGLSV